MQGLQGMDSYTPEASSIYIYKPYIKSQNNFQNINILDIRKIIFEIETETQNRCTFLFLETNK